MNKLITAAALMAIFTISAFAQTPVPTATKPTAPAASAPAGGGTGAEGKVASLNILQFRDGIQELKVKMDALNVEFEPKRKELESMQAQIEALKKKINDQGATANAQTKAQWAEEGADLEKNYTRKTEDWDRLAGRRVGEVRGPIDERIMGHLQKYCAQRGIAMVVELSTSVQAGVLLYFSPQTDITTDFIAEYNKLYPGGGVTAPKKD